jgi:hypothetical protein
MSESYPSSLIITYTQPAIPPTRWPNPYRALVAGLLAAALAWTWSRPTNNCHHDCGNTTVKIGDVRMDV